MYGECYVTDIYCVSKCSGIVPGLEYLRRVAARSVYLPDVLGRFCLTELRMQFRNLGVFEDSRVEFAVGSCGVWG